MDDLCRFHELFQNARPAANPAANMRYLYLFFLILPGFAALAPLYAQTISCQIPLPEALKEVSGMVRTPAGHLWLHNDSNNPAELFLFDPVDQKILETRKLPVKNFDWEDLASDAEGWLYIGDFGNNYNRRQNLRILRYHPATGQLDSIQFRYPDQSAFPPAHEKDWNFNMEAMVYFQDSLHLFSKNAFKGDFVCKHYVLPARPGVYVAELREEKVIKNRVITGAAISRDGKTLALTGYIIGKKLGFLPYTRASAMFFNQFQGSRFFSGKMTDKRLPKRFLARQFESIAHWDSDKWLVANEGRKPQRQAVWKIKHHTKG